MTQRERWGMLSSGPMRKLLPSLVLFVFAAACTPMKTIKTSSLVFLTPAGATIAIARPSAEVVPAVEQLFGDRGFAVYDRKDVSTTDKVLFFKGNRDRINRRGRPDQYGNTPTGYDAYGNPTYGPQYNSNPYNANQPTNPNQPYGSTTATGQPPTTGATTTTGASPTATTQPRSGTADSAQMREQNYVSRDVGSWFSVRATTENNRTVLKFYGKPTVFNAEGCGQGDSDLRDTGYSCRELTVRADWPGHQLVEGREETQVISTIIAVLGERWPLQ